MKKYFLLMMVSIPSLIAISQPPKKSTQDKQPTQSQMDKMLEDAMKAEGMSKAEQEEMKKMMKDMMPAMTEQNTKTADYPEFTNNLQLIPKKDPAKIAAFSKKALTKTEVAGYATSLYNKMLAKGESAEIAIVKKVLAMTPKGSDINGAAILSMLQGHPQAALALSIKAVTTDPSNLNWQNNMAALLTSYGYPEQAMPLLKKLKNEMPGNSTIYNNLGQAWILAGEVDSAKRYFSIATRLNPSHHEAKSGEGLIEEVKGDHEKAGETYQQAMELSPNPFIEQMRKNNKGNKGGDLDFEKIKRHISIYEYFKKDWMKEPPVLHNNVKYYNEDYGMINAYKEMIRDMGDRINEMTNTLNAELDQLTQKGEDYFIREMTKDIVGGLSFMSKPATVVLRVLMAYTKKWHLDYADTLKKITEWKFGLEKNRQSQIDAIYKQISDSKGTSCAQFKGQLDKLENDYMQQVNSRLRELLVRKVEEYRQWLNAWCTWSWYVSGNPKNVILMQDINFTQYLAEMYTQIVTSMEVKPEHCSPPVREVKEKIYAPDIPNFSCPAVVGIPVGAEWEGLVAAAKDFDANHYQIKKTDKPLPNVSVSYGPSTTIGQPGDLPYIKIVNGSIMPVGYTSSPSSELSFSPTNGKKPKSSVLLPGAEADDLVGLNINQDKESQAIEKARNQLASQLQYALFQTSCDGLIADPKIKMFEKLVIEGHKELLKKIEAEKAAEDRKIKRMQELAEDVKDNSAKTIMEEAIKLHQDLKAGKIEFKEYVKSMDEVVNSLERLNRLPTMDKIYEAFKVIDNMKTSAAIIKHGPQMLKDLQQHGLQASISSGLQAPGTFTPNKTLFQ